MMRGKTSLTARVIQAAQRMQFKTATLRNARGCTEKRNPKKGDLPQLPPVKSQRKD
jgi:hypothetical protein